jgi:hypothetical protein
MTHALKCDPGFYKSIVDGTKTFDVRRHDRPFKVGDKLLLQEYNRETEKYSGQEWHGEITYILDSTDYCKKNFVILGIRENGAHYD